MQGPSPALCGLVTVQQPGEGRYVELTSGVSSKASLPSCSSRRISPGRRMIGGLVASSVRRAASMTRRHRDPPRLRPGPINRRDGADERPRGSPGLARLGAILKASRMTPSPPADEFSIFHLGVLARAPRRSTSPSRHVRSDSISLLSATPAHSGGRVRTVETQNVELLPSQLPVT